MGTNMLKDKPHDYMPATPRWRRQRTWILSILATLTLIYYFTSSSSTSNTQDIRPGHSKNIDWTRYAYSQYATDQHYLCNSLMVFDSLHKLNSKADRLLFYPKTWDLDISSSKDRTSQLLVMARDKYKVKLRPVEMYQLARAPDDTGETTWDASINKIHAFQQEEYDRIIHLDSDILLLQHLDELFFLPSAPVAMPRAYWKLDEPIHQGGGHKLTSLIIVLEPSESEAKTLWNLASGDGTGDDLLTTTKANSTTPSSTSTNLVLDMELLNARYANTALVLPHHNLALITGEFRRTGKQNHTSYLGPAPHAHPWDPHLALRDTKLIHFSDWPIPKPWIQTPLSLLREMQPECEYANGTPDERGCEDRVVWKGVYDEFRRKRRDVCALLSVPAPEWPPRKRPGSARVV